MISVALEVSQQRDRSMSVVARFLLEDGGERMEVHFLPPETDLEKWKVDAIARVERMLGDEVVGKAWRAQVRAERAKLLAHMERVGLDEAGVKAELQAEVMETLR